MDRQAHWESVYASKSDAQVSWTQSDPATSLSLISSVLPVGSVIDIGGGTSPLAGRLLNAGYDVAVFDISATALDRARARLGQAAARVRWLAGDVTTVDDIGRFELWHDRAVFHFLCEPVDRQRYVSLLTRSVGPGGHAVIATFALDGPPKCSGLDVRRYDGPLLAAELDPAFTFLQSVPEIHLTPWGKPQSFQYSLFRRV